MGKMSRLGLQERPGPAAAAYRAIMEGGLGLRDPRPVFVVGMARSGSTLVEQILASHPQGFGAGCSRKFINAI